MLYFKINKYYDQFTAVLTKRKLMINSIFATTAVFVYLTIEQRLIKTGNFSKTEL